MKRARLLRELPPLLWGAVEPPPNPVYTAVASAVASAMDAASLEDVASMVLMVEVFILVGD